MILIVSLSSVCLESLEVTKIEIASDALPWEAFILQFEEGDECVHGYVPLPGSVLFGLTREAFEEIAALLEEKELLEEDYASLEIYANDADQAYAEVLRDLKRSQLWSRASTAAILGIAAGIVTYALIK